MAFLIDISIAFHIGSIFLSLLLAASILKRDSYYKKANRYLIFMLLATTAINANAGLILSNNTDYYFYIQHLSNAVILLIGPSLYLAISGRNAKSQAENKALLHYSPFFLYLLFVLYGFTGREAGLMVDRSEPFAFLAFVVQIPLYIFLVFKKMKGKDNELFKGLRVLLWMLLATYLVQLVVALFEILIESLPDALTLNVSLLFSFGVIALAYRCFGNENVLFDSPKYAQSSLTDQQTDQLIDKLREYMQEEKPYLRADLKIGEVAEKIDAGAKQLSQVINHSLNEKFNDFVNGYRVAYVEELLQDPENEHYTLLAIAEQAGFKSGSVFNAAFKKHKGMLPSAYRKQQLKEVKG